MRSERARRSLSAISVAKACACALAAAWLLAACSDATNPDQAHPGKAVYERYCFACHQAGIAGAPKLGDAEAWTARIAQSRDVLYDNVKKGMTPGMPPRGGCPACTDQALEIAVDYMVQHVE